MWRDSFARYALAGWIRSPSAASTLVTGNRASQSISRSGCSVRSSRANATSRWAWPSPIGDEMYQGALAPGAPARPYAPLRAARGARRVRALGETAHQQVDLHRVARLGPVTGTLERDESSPDQLGEGRSRVVRTDGVGGPMHDQDRAADPGRELAYARRVRERGASWVETSVSPAVSRPQPIAPSRCLVECGSLNIWEKKNSRKSSQCSSQC